MALPGPPRISGCTDANFVAVAADGAWVGTMGVFVDAPGRAHLVGVFVEAASRGRRAGVTDALLAAAERWAREEARARRLHLYVHEDNARARAYYRRAGFTETGATLPYDLDPSETEIEMAKGL